jgi:hypothetical protein
MRAVWLWLCFAVLSFDVSVYTVEVEISTSTNFQIAPLMPLSQDLPVEISAENRQKHISDPRLVAEAHAEGQAALKHKAIPWSTLVAAFVVILTIALIKIMPAAIKTVVSQNGDEQPAVQAFKELKRLSESDLLHKGDYENYFERLDHIVRHYLEEIYAIKASSCTTPEFLQRMTKADWLDAETKRTLADFLQSTDRV